jgi:hypothetical protein
MADTREVEDQTTATSDDVLEEDDFEITIGEAKSDEAAKPEVVSLSPEEFKSLREQADSSKAIRDGIESLGARMATPVAPAPANTPEESAEEFFAKHSDEMFDAEKGAALLKEFTTRTMKKELGSVLAGLGSELAQTKRELLEAKDPYFKKYANEIDQLVASQPAEVRAQPNIYAKAWEVVRAKHQVEIEEESVNQKVADAVAAKLKELGIEAKPNESGGRPAAYQNSAGRATPAPQGSGKTVVHLPNEETRKSLEAEALRRGMELPDLLRSKGLMK